MQQLQGASAARMVLPTDLNDTPQIGGSLSSHNGQNIHVVLDELLKELREVSVELAGSIKREMELEDEVDRYKRDPSLPLNDGVRGSAGYSMSVVPRSGAQYAGNDQYSSDALERLQKTAQLEKAQLRLDASQKIQEMLSQRKAVEFQMHSLEEQLRTQQRRLTEERQLKENLEALLTGMQEEIEAHKSEADSLRHAVPELQNRIGELESQAANAQNLALENSRMLQENQSLRNENQTLANARRVQLDIQQNSARFRSIAEEEEPGSPVSPFGAPGLSRSNSLARTASTKRLSNSQARPKDGTSLAEASSDSFKDMEDQRDALHRTLQSLLLRQERMTIQHSKKLALLQTERESAIAGSRRRVESSFEIQHVRKLMDNLRRRADDAMEQKWQCEKGLSGLKMDLDRSQEEISSLRGLLGHNNHNVTRHSVSEDKDIALESVNANLKTTFAQVQSTAAMHLAERPDSRETSSSLTSELYMKTLDQLSANSRLSDRLTGVIERRVAEQQIAAKKITDLEISLQAAEENVHLAASASEEILSQQEEHMRTMRESVEEQHRHCVNNYFSDLKSKDSISRLTHFSSDSMLRTFEFGQKPSFLAWKSSVKALSLTDASQVEVLESSIAHLERVAIGAESEMQSIIEHMNQAQLDVGNLQSEREEATRQTRILIRRIAEKG